MNRSLRFKVHRFTALLGLIVSGSLLSRGLAHAAETEARTADPSAPSAVTQAPSVPAYRKARHVAVLTVHGPIDAVTEQSLERRIRRAVNEGADAIVLDIDTPGGELTATLDICALLKDPTITPPNTVAWIHPEAYSAGTIIALACREIVISPNATFGDAAPIQVAIGTLVQMSPTERAKMEAPILTEVIDSSRRNHYDENLVQSFVAVGIELWLVESTRTGERIFVDLEEYKTIFGSDPPKQLTNVTPTGPALGAAQSIAPLSTLLPTAPPDAAELGLSPEEIKKQIEFEQQLPPLRRRLTKTDRGQWRLVSQVISSDRLLTVKPTEAMAYGLAVATIPNDTKLKELFGASMLTRYDRTWSEGLVRVLMSWPVKIVLIIIFLICLFVELAAPGVGTFGAAAMVALLLLVGTPHLAGLAQWWDLAMIATGLLLLALEIFVIPGMGVAGIAGALCLLAGLVSTFVTDDLSTPAGQTELWTGVASTFTAVFASSVGIWLISRQIHSFPVLNRLILKAELRPSGHRDSSSVGILEAMGAPDEELKVGDIGVAETDLRPAGRGRFGGKLLDVHAPGRYIERGVSIRVMTVGRYVIEVEESDA